MAGEVVSQRGEGGSLKTAARDTSMTVTASLGGQRDPAWKGTALAGVVVLSDPLKKYPRSLYPRVG